MLRPYPLRRVIGASSERAAHMDRAVRAALVGAGLDEDSVAAVADALARGMAPRFARLDDESHPAYLHPGRSVLVLLRDAGVVDPAALSGAALIESEDAALRAGSGSLPEGPSTPLATPTDGRAVPRDEYQGPGERWWDEVPRPDEERIAERMLELPPCRAAAVLAERLDHLRHLHVRPDLRPLWRARFDEVERVWGPLAGRTSAGLARRYRHWIGSFGRRLERGRYPQV